MTAWRPLPPSSATPMPEAFVAFSRRRRARRAQQVRASSPSMYRDDGAVRSKLQAIGAMMGA